MDGMIEEAVVIKDADFGVWWELWYSHVCWGLAACGVGVGLAVCGKGIG